MSTKETKILLFVMIVLITSLISSSSAQLCQLPQQLASAPTQLRYNNKIYTTTHQASKTVDCYCDALTQSVNCNAKNLSNIPSVFPKNTRKIYLKSNNITAIGPFAFGGLKRLQRIDLSDNNIVRIDAQAFLGGLSSLNQLLLYSNKITQLPANVFSELTSLQLLLLNTNNIQCVNKDLFQSLANLNLLSLHDNNIETLPEGIFDGLTKIKTLHLGKNPFVCDCNLGWLLEYFDVKPIEASGATCEAPLAAVGKRLASVPRQNFRCEEPEANARATLISSQCGVSSAPTLPAPIDPFSVHHMPTSSNIVNVQQVSAQQQQSQCPVGCICHGSTIDCSPASTSETKPTSFASSNSYQDLSLTPTVAGGGQHQFVASQAQNYNLMQHQQTPTSEDLNVNVQQQTPVDVLDDVPIFFSKVQLNDSRMKKIRQTGLFRRLVATSSSSHLTDLKDKKLLGIEEHLSNYLATNLPNEKPQKIVFVYVQSDDCNDARRVEPLDACTLAPKINAPNYDSPCYNGATCIRSATSVLNFTCACPTGFGGTLCETNIDDCLDHQCQNGAACIDGLNSYRCVCRDPQTSGEFCELLNSIDDKSTSNSLAPMALPIISATPTTTTTTQVLASENGAQQNIHSTAPNLQGQKVTNNPSIRELRTVSENSNPTAALQDTSFFTTTSSPTTTTTTATANSNMHAYQKVTTMTPPLFTPTMDSMQLQQMQELQELDQGSCKRVSQRLLYDDGYGCKSIKPLKISECRGTCALSNDSGINALVDTLGSSSLVNTKTVTSSCLPSKVKQRHVRMQCTDGASYVKTIDVIRGCRCATTALFGNSTSTNLVTPNFGLQLVH